MRLLVAAVAAVLLAAPAWSAECKRYVRETSDGEWITIRGDKLKWHTMPEVDGIWTITTWDEAPEGPVRIAYDPEAENDGDIIAFRYVTLDGVAGIIYDAVFYREATCIPSSAIEGAFQR